LVWPPVTAVYPYLQVLGAVHSIMLHVVEMHSVVKYVYLLVEHAKLLLVGYIASFHIEVLFICYFLFCIVCLFQLLIAKGASLTAENANGYVSIDIC
jgi:hypothetical protein